MSRRPAWLDTSSLPSTTSGPDSTLLLLGGFLLLLFAVSEAALLSVSRKLLG